MNTPSAIKIVTHYRPDPSRMVRALLVLLERRMPGVAVTLPEEGTEEPKEELSRAIDEA